MRARDFDFLDGDEITDKACALALHIELCAADAKNVRLYIIAGNFVVKTAAKAACYAKLTCWACFL